MDHLTNPSSFSFCFFSVPWAACCIGCRGVSSRPSIQDARRDPSTVVADHPLADHFAPYLTVCACCSRRLRHHPPSEHPECLGSESGLGLL